MFCFFDSLLIAIIVKSVWIKTLAIFVIFGGLECTLIVTNFNFEMVNKTTIAALCISIIYTAILIPVFCQICNLIMT